MRRSELWFAALAVGVGLAGPALAQTAEMARGEAVYDDRCSGCHLLEGIGQGPSLRGVMGRKAGTLAGFDYTPALKASGLTWTAANLERWLTGPQKLVPGTAMTAVVPDAHERSDLLAYLAALK
ncbi:MAG TPA: c-type cytochrome [Caulobacteraceae bacterium]|nr:c-type cytochrome [Caulobacteraceae bacterium]